MNGEDQFEERLKRQGLKPLPAEWREEILGAAHTASGKDASHRMRELSPERRGRGGTRPYQSFVISAAVRVISNLIWPNGKAWAGLTAVWIMIIGFGLANRDGGDTCVPAPAPQSALVRELLQQQGRLFAELTNPKENGETMPPRRLKAGPRSDWKQSGAQA